MTTGDRRHPNLHKIAERSLMFTLGALVLASLWFTSHSADQAAREDMIEDARTAGAIRFKGRAFICRRVDYASEETGEAWRGDREYQTPDEFVPRDYWDGHNGSPDILDRANIAEMNPWPQ